MPGVHAVLTHADVPGAKTYGLEFADQPVLAIDRVRYFGEPVALVAAEHPEQARRAAEQVRVEYEPLEPVVDMERATEQPPIHDENPTAGHGFREDPRPNVVRSIVVRHGDPTPRATSPSSGVYELGIQDQAFLGPESGLAVPDGEGRRRRLRRDAVAARRPRPGRALPRARAGAGAHPPRRGRRRVRRPRGPVDADPRRAARAAHRPAGEDRLQRARSRSSATSTGTRRRSGCEHRATRDGRLVNVRARILLDGGAYASSSDGRLLERRLRSPAARTGSRTR